MIFLGNVDVVLRESIFELPDKDMDKIPPQAVSCSLKAWFLSTDVILKQDEAIDKFKEVLSGVSGDTSLFVILRRNNNRTGKDDPQYFAEISEEESLLQSRLIEEKPNPVPNPKVINSVSEWLQKYDFNDSLIEADLPNMSHSNGTPNGAPDSSLLKHGTDVNAKNNGCDRGTNIKLKNRQEPNKHNPNSHPLKISPTLPPEAKRKNQYYDKTERFKTPSTNRALGCVNAPKVIECMQTRIHVIILVINNSPSQIKPKFLYI